MTTTDPMSASLEVRPPMPSIAASALHETQRLLYLGHRALLGLLTGR
jgi:hypothetical protein